MSATESASRKKRVTEPAKRTAEDDHRRKRRNRTTQSCLNCHTSKRMCDRKRPCGRCTQLGLTGLCVYEVDDPSQQADVSDEKARLQKRVAELESVIRELKNKPHPRWVQTLDKAKLRLRADSTSTPTSPPRSSSEESESPSSSSPRIHLHLPRLAHLQVPHRSYILFDFLKLVLNGLPPPIDVPSPLSLSPTDSGSEGGYDFARCCHRIHDGNGLDGNLDNLLDGLMRHEHIGLTHSDPCHMHHDRGHCGCLTDATSYSVVLELSLRLRRAAEVLSHDAKHRASPNCPIHQRITDLDRRASERKYHNTDVQSYGTHPNFPPSLPATASTARPNNIPGTVAPHSLHASVRLLMSWEPSRRSTDWAQSSGL
ncbi:hypothetical protein BC629DRAFT_1554409 [Irpex lacteus]|nr:hypothetical protein BC629DRAFT_1554409 [Irpex lacteus]